MPDEYAECSHWEFIKGLYYRSCIYCDLASWQVPAIRNKEGWWREGDFGPGYHDGKCSSEKCKGRLCSEKKAVCEACFLQHFDILKTSPEDRFGDYKVTATKKLPLSRNAKSAANKV